MKPSKAFDSQPPDVLDILGCVLVMILALVVAILAV